MVDTLYTSDGKMHVLLGSTTLSSLVREYMGDDVADAVAHEEDRLAAWEEQANSWLTTLDRVLYGAEQVPRKYPRAKLLSVLQDLREQIECEV